MNQVTTTKVSVALEATSRGYDIIIGAQILGEAGALIKQRLGARRCVIISDQNVAPLYQQRLEAILIAAGHTILPGIVIPPGEASKDFTTLNQLLDQLFSRTMDRQTLIIALGGGVIGDLAGVTASLTLRGIDFVQIPTTLLAQVDSSVGGKTGINSAYGKNTIGAFYQPRLVLADVATLDSLPPRELLAGYAEVVKYGLIRDVEFFNWCHAHGGKLLHGDHEAQIYAVSKSCTHKAEIVVADEREAGERALLNFGHTFGHALETATGYGKLLLHGEAVAIGMALAFRLSYALGLCPYEDVAAVNNHFTSINLPLTPPSFDYNIDQLMQLMAQDKKAEAGRLTLILTRGIGKAFVSKDVDADAVRTIWQKVVG